MQERYLVISSDCHAGLPNAEYRPYLDPQYREKLDVYLAEREALMAAQRINVDNEDFVKAWEEETGEGLNGGWDVARRDKELDGDGVAGEIIFPDSDAVTGGAGAPFGAGLGMSSTLVEPELLFAGAKAHNRWLSELCQESPERRCGVALMPVTHDVERAVQDVHEAREMGLKAVLIPSMWNDKAPYHDPMYDPFWAACQDLEMPIHTHSGSAPHTDYGPPGPGHTGMYVAEVRWWAARPIHFLLWSGVFERFPRLKFCVAESGCFWAADLLWSMDLMFDKTFGGVGKLGKITEHLSMRPSEYFDRNCSIGASNTRRRELARRFEIGQQNIMWGNDFPHPEGTWPHTAEALKKVFWDIPPEDTAQVLGLNAAEFYGFDVKALRPLADRIGPTPDDLGQTDPSVFSKWDELRKAGRPWITGIEATPVPVV
jgi:predicted TIM-barrel fold metal-dependent hydrolase